MGNREGGARGEIGKRRVRGKGRVRGSAGVKGRVLRPGRDHTLIIFLTLN